MSTDLLFMPAVKAAALIRARKLSAVDYVDAVLTAIERAQPALNCFREVMAGEARREAKKAEEAVTRGDRLGPLHGVPVSVKDLIDVAGVPTRHGSAIFEDNVAKTDDVLVQRLRAAGAIIVGKSTTPEFGVKGLTDGPSFGVTRNPMCYGWAPCSNGRGRGRSIGRRRSEYAG
jgi:aspartyl-tRNA(Asn)/glutamyl-tRNA(Gln) amidotransferase subunit A